MDLQLRDSIYQCNPRCSIGKRCGRNHVPTSKMNDNLYKAFKPTLLNRLECDRGDLQELQRNNYLNETVSML